MAEYILPIAVYLAAVALGIHLWIRYTRNRNDIPEALHGTWNHYFKDLQFSAQEFYLQVEGILKGRKIPDTSISRVTFSQRISILSGKREYLRVRNGPYSFDICAAPYGTGFFVSWWMGEDMGCLMRALFLVPLIGPYLKRKALLKTYYILDTEDMFLQATHEAVIDAIEAVIATKGLRALSEADKHVTRRKRIE